MKGKLITAGAVASSVGLAVAGTFAGAAMASGASPAPAGTAYGCVVTVGGQSRVFADVYTSETNYLAFLDAHGGKCPSGFEATIGSSPAPSPAPSSSPSPSPTSGSTPPPSGWSCTTTDMSSSGGACDNNGKGYTDYAGMSDFTGDVNIPYPMVSQDAWGVESGQTQELDANSPGDWQVKSMIPRGSNPGNAVTTYPNSGMDLDGSHDLTAYGDITSSLADTVPAASTGASGWQGYDIWYNNWADEMMVQTQYVNAAPCSYDAVAQFTEPGTSVQQTFGLCNFGSEKVWHLVPPGTQAGGSAVLNETSGSVDITAMTGWLISNGYMTTKTPATTTLTALSAGFEIVQSPSQSTWGYSSLTFKSSVKVSR